MIAIGTTGFFETWHYINYPYVPNDPPNGPITSVNAEHNVVWALNLINSTFHQVQPNELELSRALYFHIHFMGDIHQPLHSMTLYSSKHEPPVGDAGGNLYSIQGANVTSLHKFWDSGAGLWGDDYDRPLNKSSSAAVLDFTEGLMKDYPETSYHPSLFGMHFEDYAREAAAFAANLTYTTPENETVTKDYVSASRLGM